VITLQQLIDRLISIRDGDKISPNAPVLLVEDWDSPFHPKHKGINIRISEQDHPDDEYEYVIRGDDGFRYDGDAPTEVDHSVIIYWEPVE